MKESRRSVRDNMYIYKATVNGVAQLIMVCAEDMETAEIAVEGLSEAEESITIDGYVGEVTAVVTKVEPEFLLGIGIARSLKYVVCSLW